MNIRYKTFVIALSLTFIIGGAVAVIKSKTLANGIETQSKSSDSSGLTPERKKELEEKVLSIPVAVVHTKHGDFLPVEDPNEYPSNQVANLDFEDIEDSKDIVTSETKQIILKGFYYEKK